MNNGGKAEKENTPSEANLQEEEVPGGSLRRGHDLGRRSPGSGHGPRPDLWPGPGRGGGGARGRAGGGSLRRARF